MINARLLSQPHRRWALACVAGLLNGVAFIDYGAMSLVANVPLLVALTRASSASEAAGLGALVGFLGGAHIYGVLNYGWFLFLAFSVYTASQMVIYALVFRLFWGQTRSWFDVLLPALSWSLTEWVRTIGALSMPASYVGNLADLPWFTPWLYLAPLMGGLGVSLIAGFVQSLFFHVLIDPRKYARESFFGACVVLALGLCGWLNPPSLGHTPREVAGVQGGLANFQYEAAQADRAMMREVVKTYGTLSQRAYAADVHWAIWPETAVRAPVLRRRTLQKELFPFAPARTTLIAGVIETNQQGQRFNAAAAVYQGTVQDIYRKVRLVPGTEDHFTSGKELRPLDTPHGAVGVMICLESVYGDLARELTLNGAEVFVVQSNDAGFGRSPITRHMTNRARVRALENGRWLVRVGQAGISAIINPRGDVEAELGLFEPGLLRGQVGLRSDKTPYVRYGNWTIWVVFIGFLWATIYRVRRAPARFESASLTT